MFIVKVHAESYPSVRESRNILGTGRAGQTRAGRANGQSIAAEREAMQYMTPRQLQQSAARYQRMRTANR